MASAEKKGGGTAFSTKLLALIVFFIFCCSNSENFFRTGGQFVHDLSTSFYTALTAPNRASFDREDFR